MPRRNTQTSRKRPASKNSFVMTKTFPIAEHPRNSRNDSCVPKFIKEVNSRAKVPSNKTTNRNKPVEQKGVPHKQERLIPTGHRFSIQKISVVQKKTMTPRSCLSGNRRVKFSRQMVLDGYIFQSERRRTQSLVAEKTDISETRASRNIHLMYKMMTSDHNSSELRIHDHNIEPSSSKLVPNVVPLADKTATTRQALELIFHHHITMLR
nr:hypothetical protein [Tanacetum cinerariifolium]